MRETNVNLFEAQQGHSLLERIVTALQGLRYGSVEIIVHDGRIVQIERKERWRLNIENSSTTTKGWTER